MDLKVLEADLPFKLPDRSDCSAEWVEAMRGYQIFVPNGEILYIERFFDKKISDRSVEYFLENDTTDWRDHHGDIRSAKALWSIRFSNINWKQDHIKMYGRNIPLPRLTA